MVTPPSARCASGQPLQQFRHRRQPVQLGPALVAVAQVGVEPVGVHLVETAEQVTAEQPTQFVVIADAHRSTPISSNAVRNARTA